VTSAPVFRAPRSSPPTRVRALSPTVRVPLPLNHFSPQTHWGSSSSPAPLCPLRPLTRVPFPPSGQASPLPQVPRLRNPTRPVPPLSRATPEAWLFPLLPPPRLILTESLCLSREPPGGFALTFPVIAGSGRHLCCPTSVGIGD
jgi:hypothetical protein